jgi:hypothetical protein
MIKSVNLIRLSVWAFLALLILASEDISLHEQVLEYARANGADVS